MDDSIVIKIGFMNFWQSIDHPEMVENIQNLFINPLKRYSKFTIDDYIYNPVTEDCDLILYSVFDTPDKLKDVRLDRNPKFVCFSGEQRLDEYLLDGAYSLSFKLDSPTNVYYPLWRISSQDFSRPVPIQKTKFCTFIVSNEKSSFRNEVFQYICDNYKKIDSCGRAFNNMDGLLLPQDLKLAVDFHKPYKFNLCFENAKSNPGEIYITEKIINAYKYGTVPVYWGSEDVVQFFNPKSFINCNGLTPPEILEIMKFYDRNDDLYYQMLEQHPFNHRVDWFEVNNYRFVQLIDKLLEDKYPEKKVEHYAQYSTDMEVSE